MGLTKPAFTAASPSTKAPTIERALPNVDGVLISVSLNISNVTVRTKGSIIVGNGTPCFCIAKLTNNPGGIIS